MAGIKLCLLLRPMFRTLSLAALLFLTTQVVCQSGFDDRLLLDINRNNQRDFQFWKWESKLSPPVSFAVPVGLAATGWLRNDKSMMQKGLTATACIGLTVVETYAIKNLVRRPRPYTRLTMEKHADASSWSFPSGHTSTAFAAATALTLEYPRWQVAVPAFLFASASGYSRMRLGVHYPSDVLVGAALGIGTGFLVHRISQHWR
jgi:membrane-associated phospholipid phosphatase